MQRIFIGIPVDKHSQQQINKLLEPIKGSRQDIRWVAENNRHLSLAFLGDQPISRVDNLLRRFAETYQQEKQFRYRLSSLNRFPDSRGRIIALTDEPDRCLDNLFQITLKLLQKINIEIDRKKFRPHITLGRIRRPKHVKTSFDRQTDINVEINQITLFQSTLTESGSIYTALKVIHLPPKCRNLPA